MPYECVSADGNLAAIVVTNLETGDTLPACPDCMPTILLSLVESATGQTFAPVGEPVPDLDTDDATDDDEHRPPSVPQTPPGSDPAPEVDPGGPDDDEADDDGSDSLTRQEEAFIAETVEEWAAGPTG